MRKLSGPEWFAKYRRPGEGRFKAIERLQRETDLNLKTLYRACVHQWRVEAETVDALERVAGLGRLDRDSFLSAPTEKDAKRAALESGLPPTRKQRSDAGVPLAKTGSGHG